MKTLPLIISMMMLFPATQGTAAQTPITIVGTVHTATPAFTKTYLYKIIEDIKPDLILFEFDSSLMGTEMKFRKDFLNIFEVSVIDSF